MAASADKVCGMKTQDIVFFMRMAHKIRDYAEKVKIISLGICCG